MSKPRSAEKEFEIVAKAGFLSKELWMEFFGKGLTKRSRNHVWRALRESRYFAPHPNHRYPDVIVMNRRSPVAVARAERAALPPGDRLLVHDELLLRGILKMVDQGFIESWTMESALRAEGQGAFKTGTVTGSAKFPDALLWMRGHTPLRKLAIEMERTQKSNRRNEQIMTSYGIMRGLDKVLFVCGSPAIEDALKRAAMSSFYAVHGIELGFMGLDGWKEEPLLAEVHSVDGRMSLGAWLEEADAF